MTAKELFEKRDFLYFDVKFQKNQLVIKKLTKQTFFNLFEYWREKRRIIKILNKMDEPKEEVTK